MSPAPAAEPHHPHPPLRLRVVSPPGIAGIVLACASDEFEVRDRDGTPGRGFTNLRRLLGRPADFAFVVDQLAATVPAGHAVAAADEGAWALTGAIALRLAAPAVLVRRTPKTYFASYGSDPAAGGGLLAGEKLPPGTGVHLIDDLIFSGQTLAAARRALQRAGLEATAASAILWTRRADAAAAELTAAGLAGVTCLASQRQVEG